MVLGIVINSSCHLRFEWSHCSTVSETAFGFSQIKLWPHSSRIFVSHSLWPCRCLNCSSGFSNISSAPAIASIGHWMLGIFSLTPGLSSMAFICLIKVSGPILLAIDTQRLAMAFLVCLFVNPSTSIDLRESNVFPDLRSL